MSSPQEWFPHFYRSPAIAELGRQCRWTISGQLGDESSGRKAPIDVRHLVAGCSSSCRHSGPVRGAFALDETCLMTLPELTTALPMASNVAFFLRAATDGLLVIDVEPSCPRPLAHELAGLPGVLYSETSMSGHGLHLLTPLPGNFHEHELAASKKVLREEHGWFEVLLEHWVTFTRNPVTGDVFAPVQDAPPFDPGREPFGSLEDLWSRLAASARENAAAEASSVTTSPEPPRIAYRDEIVERVVANTSPRDPADFENDLSRWEFSTLGSLFARLRTVLAEYASWGVAYDHNQVTWLLYLCAVRILPHRAKHDQQRGGRPYLMERAAALVADRTARAATRAASGAAHVPHSSSSPSRSESTRTT